MSEKHMYRVRCEGRPLVMSLVQVSAWARSDVGKTVGGSVVRVGDGYDSRLAAHSPEFFAVSDMDALAQYRAWIANHPEIRIDMVGVA